MKKKKTPPYLRLQSKSLTFVARVLGFALDCSLLLLCLLAFIMLVKGFCRAVFFVCQRDQQAGGLHVISVETQNFRNSSFVLKTITSEQTLESLYSTHKHTQTRSTPQKRRRVVTTSTPSTARRCVKATASRLPLESARVLERRLCVLGGSGGGASLLYFTC